MKIMLVYPQFETHIITPPLGLGYLASVLRNAGHEVILLDCLLKGIPPKKIEVYIKAKRPDIVGITAMTTFYFRACRYTERVKAMGIPVILGGQHATARPIESLIESNADYVIFGEGEETIVELLEKISEKASVSDIRGIVYWKNGKPIINPPRELIMDLNTIPFPTWDMMPPNKYPLAPHGAVVKNYPVAQIVSTRGCPFNCSYCASKCIWRQKLRFRDPIKVVDEIEYLVKNYGVKEIHFEDDNITADKKHCMAICDEILRREIKISWACPNGVRIDRIDEELIDKMKRSGCYLLAFGIESGNQRIVDSVGKHLDLKIVPNVLDTVKKYNIETWGFFILGLPGETKETIIETISFAKNNKFDRAQFCIFTPLPGSEAFDNWTKEKKIDKFEWDNFNFFTVVYENDILKKEELKKLQKKAFREFYFRPKILWGIISKIKLQQIKWLVKRAIAYKL